MSSKFDVPSNFDRRIGGVGISTVPLTTDNVLNEDDENLDVTDAKKHHNTTTCSTADPTPYSTSTDSV
jgi:hypothetical protein